MQTYRLNRQITFEKETTSKNAVGTPVETFATLKKKYATVTHEGGSTQSDEYGEIASTTTEFTIRYDSEINYKCRVLYMGEYYKILHIEQIGRSEGMRLRTVKFEEE